MMSFPWLSLPPVPPHLRLFSYLQVSMSVTLELLQKHLFFTSQAHHAASFSWILLPLLCWNDAYWSSKICLFDIISLARTFPALEPGYILLLVEIWYLLLPLWKSSWYLCFLVCKCACFCWCNSVTQHTGQTKMSKFGAEKCLLHDHARKLVAHVLKIFQTPQTKITKHF